MIGTNARVGAAGALALLLVGCTGASAPPEQDASQPAATTATQPDVPFTDCAAACEGEIAGANYRILLPDQWNGTLLLYSHGYRSPAGAGGEATADTRAEPSPAYNEGGAPLARALLDEGYALAGSGWASNGWAVADGVRANVDLLEFFRDEVAEPEQVYAWGDSLGGLVTMETVEAHPELVSGAAVLCGVVGGVVPNMDLALDVQYAVRELIDPDSQLTRFPSAQAAEKQLVSTAGVVLDTAADPQDRANVVALALLVDAALQTQTQDGTTLDSQVQAAAEAALTALRFGTVARWEIEERFGGNISGNVGTDYSARFSAEDRALLDEVGGPGTARGIIRALERGERIAADDRAVAKARTAGGEPSGTIEVPTLTLHTAADPLVAVQNHSLLRSASGPTDDLVQLFTVAPDAYPASPGAAYGAGHCNFTPDSRVGMVDLLDEWVRNDVYPSTDVVAEALGSSSGYDPGFSPGPWVG